MALLPGSVVKPNLDPNQTPCPGSFHLPPFPRHHRLTSLHLILPVQQPALAVKWLISYRLLFNPGVMHPKQAVKVLREMECGLQCGEVKRSLELEHMCVTGPCSCLPQWPGHFEYSVNPKSIACGLNNSISHPYKQSPILIHAVLERECH